MVSKFGFNSELKMKEKKAIDLLFLFTLLVSLLYIFSPFEFWDWNPIFYNIEKVTLGIQFVLFALSILIIKRCIEKKQIQFNKIDTLFSIYSIFYIIHATILNPISFELIFVVENILLVLLYIGFRNVSRKDFKYLFLAVILATLYQIYYGVLVQTKWFAPGFGLSDIKGSYINQGPFAGVIACSALITFGFVLNAFDKVNKQNFTKKWLIITIYTLLLCLLLFVLFYSNSRSAWLALSIGLLFYVWHLQAIKLWVKKIFHSIWLKFIFYSVSIFIVVGAVYQLYSYKKDSADGRILIWKITSEMVYDKPLLGHGINTFQSNFMSYQENYFAKNKNDSLKYLANNNEYAFNEFIKVLSEQGLLGLSVILIIGYLFIRSIKKVKKNHWRFISQSGLLLIILFGLFSYPLKILQLKIIVLLFMSVLSNSFNEIKKNQKSKIFGFNNGNIDCRKTINISIIYFLLSTGVFFGWHKTYKVSNIYRNWNSILFKMKKGDFKNYITFSEKHYETLHNNGYFLGYYGKALVKERLYIEAIKMFKKALLIIPSTEVCIDIGESYKNLGNYKMAERFWMRASNMVPSQFRPQYLIAKMYFEIGQKDKARMIASDLLNNKKVKVYSIEVYQIIEELKRMIEL